VIATAGPYGAYLAAGRECYSAPAVKVEHIRSLKGAGDTFLAAFLYAVYEKQFDPAPALAFAARAASKKIASPGGVYPDLRKT
jgi:sugar/nucleoside kinase (ribokinase family)